MHAGVAVGTEFCNAESLPMTDPSLWTFHISTATETKKPMTTVHTKDAHTTQPVTTVDVETSKLVTTVTDTGVRVSASCSSARNNLIIITTICTLLAFIIGTVCGLIAHRSASVLLRKWKADRHNVSVLNSGWTVHNEKGILPSTDESCVIYDEITPHYSNSPEIKQKENVAYEYVTAH